MSEISEERVNELLKKRKPIIEQIEFMKTLTPDQLKLYHEKNLNTVVILENEYLETKRSK